jgi:hypothetical protein
MIVRPSPRSPSSVSNSSTGPMRCSCSSVGGSFAIFSISPKASNPRLNPPATLNTDCQAYSNPTVPVSRSLPYCFSKKALPVLVSRPIGSWTSGPHSRAWNRRAATPVSEEKSSVHEVSIGRQQLAGVLELDRVGLEVAVLSLLEDQRPLELPEVGDAIAHRELVALTLILFVVLSVRPGGQVCLVSS